MRLTAELAATSLSYLNPLKERELDLRGHKIPALENLAAAPGEHDALDLTDNALVSLSNLPRSPRLRTLLLARNRIRHIQPDLVTTAPNLHAIALAANLLAELADLEPLAALPRLTHLVLLDNPVARKDHYRLWLVWRCPALRFLDYRRVRDVEREKARELFGESRDAPTALAEKILGIKSRTFEVGNSSTDDAAAAGSATAGRVALTPEERKRVEEMIRNAKTLTEISRLEKELNEGRIPG